MAKVAVLVPSQELCNLAQPLVGTFPSITLMTLEYIKTSQAESGPESWNGRAVT